mmetsp:Transcript_20197/g.32736  ORF Transcript_20197/g.32736 Transcript_20197/m.32736 type:complete len:288 (-) Transcript_20197:655-1518(-)
MPLWSPSVRPPHVYSVCRVALLRERLRVSLQCMLRESLLSRQERKADGVVSLRFYFCFTSYTSVHLVVMSMCGSLKLKKAVPGHLAKFFLAHTLCTTFRSSFSSATSIAGAVTATGPCVCQCMMFSIATIVCPGAPGSCVKRAAPFTPSNTLREQRHHQDHCVLLHAKSAAGPIALFSAWPPTRVPTTAAAARLSVALFCLSASSSSSLARRSASHASASQTSANSAASSAASAAASASLTARAASFVTCSAVRYWPLMRNRYVSSPPLPSLLTFTLPAAILCFFLG